MQNAIIVGGGTGGHIIPAIVVAKSLKEKGYKLTWIGSKKGKKLEEKIIRQYFPNIKIYHLFCGKLRRGKNLFSTIFNLYNFLDIFQFIAGTITSIFILLSIKPKFIFSKGGFVSVPVAIASKFVAIPFYTHESDYTIGLANKINLYFSKKFFYSFTDTSKQIKSTKAIFSSNPIREEFLNNSTDLNNLDEEIFSFLNQINKDKPLILVLGGSLGSAKINNFIFEILPDLCKDFNIIHQTGENKKIDFSNPSYLQVSYINKGVSTLMKISSLIISRAGANLVFEIVATKRPTIFIPLKSASRGEQINNAMYFANKLPIYKVLDEEKLDSKLLLTTIFELIQNHKNFDYDSIKNDGKIVDLNIRAEEIIIKNIEKDLNS